MYMYQVLQTRYHCSTLEGDLMYLYGGKVPSYIRGGKEHNQVRQC